MSPRQFPGAGHLRVVPLTPTLAAAIHTGRRGGRKRVRGGGEGGGGGEGAEGEGPEPTGAEGRGFSRPYTTFCSIPRQIPPFTPHYLPGLDPLKFFWYQILHSLPFPESPAAKGEGG